MQTMITTLIVRVPVNFDNMDTLASSTKILKEAADKIMPRDKDPDGSVLVSINQTVESDAILQSTPAPRRRGPNRAKPMTPAEHIAKGLAGAPAVEPAKDTSKPGTEVTQPAWKVQAEPVGKLETPGFLDRTKQAQAGKAA